MGDWEELHLRDYLNAHPEAAEEYVALKQELTIKYEYGYDVYTEAKGEFIRACTAKERGNKE